MMEILWKDIPGFEGLYKASNAGEIKSMNYARKKREGILKQYYDRDGYLRVDLVKDGKKKGKMVHRLVASSFLENPEGKPQVNHIDSDRSNNNLLNLEWVTGSENAIHGYRHGNRVSFSKTYWSQAARKHPTEATYKNGCRCDECLLMHKRRIDEARVRRQAKRKKQLSVAITTK